MQVDLFLMRLHCFFALLTFSVLTVEAQPKVMLGSNLILRNQYLLTYDQGGYFISDQYLKRVTYDFNVEVQLSDRLSITGAIQRIFFVTDVNFWFLTNDYVLLVKSNPIGGIQLPLHVRYNLIRNYSECRWRVGPLGGLSAGFMQNTSGTGSGSMQNRDGTISIIKDYTVQPVALNFTAIEVGAFAKYRLSPKFNLTYQYTYVNSFADRILVNDVNYQVTSGGSTQDYSARTIAHGSASNHSLGIQWVL